jgi:hypothetical protein
MPDQCPVYSILKRHVHARFLDGYIGGIIDEEKGRLYAAAFNSIDPEHYDEYGYLHAGIGVHSVHGVDQQQTRLPADDDGCYTSKDTRQCIREGIYHAFSINFFGCFYEGRWYILKELAYYGEHMSAAQARETLLQSIDDRSVLERDIYLPMEAYFPNYGQDSPPIPRGVEFQEFVGRPGLVAYLQRDKKTALCHAYTHFMNLDVVIPFMAHLKAARYETYASIIPMYSDDFTLIFPASRTFMLIPALIADEHGKHRLSYFFWHAGDRKMYQWTYFTSDTYDFSFHYSTNVIDDLSTICHWNDTAYLNSSCTLDDESFWDNYVLLKEGGIYRYLVDMTL